jgi:PAS domain S-box-containing protein
VVLVFRDFTARKQAEGTLAQLAAIVQSSDDAIIGKTLDGTITSWNTGAEQIYGYSAEEVIGRSIQLLVPPDRPDEIPQILERIKRGERIARLETIRMRKDRTLVPVSLTIKGAGAEISFQGKTKDGVQLQVTAKCSTMEEM